MDWCHAAFRSPNDAIAAQRVLRAVCPATVMPVLRQVSAGCGIALRLDPRDWRTAQAALDRADIPADYYAVTGAGEGLRCERL